MPEAGVPLVLEPAGEKMAPRTDYEGKFSLQYSTASMLVHGHVGVTDFTDEAIADPDVLALAAKVSLRAARVRHLPGGVPGRRAHHAARRARRSRPTSRTSSAAPENPMSADEVRAKFRDNAALALRPTRSRRSRRRSSRSRSTTT